MKLKDYIKSLQNAIKDNPTLADLEVWNFTDWFYSYEYGDYPTLYEVVQEERTIVQKYWKAV